MFFECYFSNKNAWGKVQERNQASENEYLRVLLSGKYFIKPNHVENECTDQTHENSMNELHFLDALRVRE